MNIANIKKQDAYILSSFVKKPTIPRGFYGTVDMNEKCVGLIGLRGVGKTTFLLQKRSEIPHSLYISCDLVQLRQVDLLDLIDRLHKTYNIQTFFLDEIHFLDNWDGYLKNIYDFLDVKIVFSGSNMIDITKGGYDLSRRAMMYHIPIFSFSEYIHLSKGISIEKYSLQDILTHHTTIATECSLRYSKELRDEYLHYGQFGYWYDTKNPKNFSTKLDNTIRKIIFEDIANVVSMGTENLNKLVDMLFFLSNGGGTSSITTGLLAKKLNINYNTADNYVDFLVRAGFLYRIYPYGTLTNTLRKEKKLFVDSSNIIYLFGEDRGFVRECFFVSCLQKVLNNRNSFKAGIHYQSQTDFVLELDDQKYFFEIGGKSKKRSDSDLFVIKDDITIGQGNNIPLWLFGLL